MVAERRPKFDSIEFADCYGLGEENREFSLSVLREGLAPIDVRNVDLLSGGEPEPHINVVGISTEVVGSSAQSDLKLRGQLRLLLISGIVALSTVEVVLLEVERGVEVMVGIWLEESIYASA